MTSKNRRKFFPRKQFSQDQEDEFLYDTETSNAINDKWFEKFQDDPSDFPDVQVTLVEQLKAEARRFMQDEVTKNNTKASKSQANSQWMRTVMSKGTISDKIAAHTLTILDSPLHSLNILQNLVNMVKASKKKDCIAVIDTLTELFLSDLLPPDRKLRVFEACPLSLLDKLSGGNVATRQARLISWYYEDQLKQLYHTFLEALNLVARDTVDNNKEKAVSAMFKLLLGNPEKEEKVVSKVIYCLGKLLQVHPNMKGVVMDEVEKLLFRPNVNTRAQYYGVCFLSQFMFTDDDKTVAKNLIKLYFSFFKSCIKKGDVDSRMMSALLIGVNRAYPFTKGDLELISDHIETLYRVVHVACFNVSVHTLCLLFQVGNASNSISDRFYSVLYKKLADTQLPSSRHHAMFLSLLFKALKTDNQIGRTKAFVKRILQVCQYMPVPLACGMLCLISQIVHKRTHLLSLKMETNFADDNDGDEEYEHYDDIKIEQDPADLSEADNADVKMLENVNTATRVNKSATWFHSHNLSHSEKTKNGQGSQPYTPYQRNPVFAGAEYCTYTELLTLTQHFHPTVALFASNILQRELIHYSGDPLQDFTLARFLDRFVFKNPKKVYHQEQQVNHSRFSRKKNYHPSGAKALSINSAQYLNKEEGSIPVDELFMYSQLLKFSIVMSFSFVQDEEVLTKKNGVTLCWEVNLYLNKKRAEGQKVPGDEREDDRDSVASEEFDEMLEGLMGGKNKVDDMDFADEIGNKLAAPSKSNDEDSDEDEIEDEDDGADNMDDEEIDDDDDEDIVFDGDDDDDDEEINFDEMQDDSNLDGSDLENFVNETPSCGRSGVGSGHLKKSGNKKQTHSVFASADEFAEILQDAGASGKKAGGAGALATKDNADNALVVLRLTAEDGEIEV
uniref:CCAAT-binding factor domain-containing protein n=1 Tax=Timema bartmani TaxID=61472 RepID=A0A7R9EV42_9NEOP|nr:unnamed protein product [Timema bartmani]